MSNTNKRTLSVLRNLTHISQNAKKEIEKAQERVEQVAVEATEVARKTLMDGSMAEDFTQKHGSLLANHIYLEYGANKGEFTIKAGNDALDNEILYELYFAEYGAGQLREDSPIYSGYVEKGRTLPNGYWFYPLLTPTTRFRQRDNKVVETKWGYTDRSLPLRYMLISKLYAKDQLKTLRPKISKSIKTSIKRGKED